MDNRDGVEFKSELVSILSFYAGRDVTLSSPDMRRWWNALKMFSLQAVVAGFDLHAKRSQFSPKPRDIISLISSQDGRPEPEEAWALAMRVADEADTVVWTEEMATAWAIAQPILADGDNVGARMAFREHYQRLLLNAREAGVPVDWRVSLGHDSSRRNDAIKLASDKGLISQQVASKFLIEQISSESMEIAGLLGFAGDNVVCHPSKNEAHRKNIARMRQALADGSALAEAKNAQIAKEQQQALASRRDLLIRQAGGITHG